LLPRTHTAVSDSLYGQDNSHLVDICRQIIVFDDLSGLLECLRIIRLDSEARVLRVKNRLDINYNSSKSAGYRDVALNLTLKSDAALANGLDTHVCEVQLMILSMYQLKVNTPHFHLQRLHLSPLPCVLSTLPPQPTFSIPALHTAAYN
jgi:hypothetical protein